MKCYNCGKTISRSHPYCEYCGVLVQPTNKLIEACALGNKKAIAQLYKISYLKIYTELLIVGVGREEGKRLINHAFRQVLKELIIREDVSHFDQLIRIVSRKVGRKYLEHFHLEPLEQPYEDVYFKVTDEMIEDLFVYLQKRKPVTVTRKKAKRKHHQWTKQDFIQLGIIGGVIVVIIIATSIVKFRNDASNNDKRIETYVTVVKQYEKGMKEVNKTNAPANLETNYPLCADAISMAYSHSVKTKNLRCDIDDVDGDGHEDLLLGYLSHKQMVITGLYMNNDVSENATNTEAITATTQKLIITEDHQVLRSDSGTYHVLSLNGKNQYEIKSTITDIHTYLEECNTSKLDLTGMSISAFTSKYGN